MPSVEPSRREDHGGLSAARAEFANSLGRRLDAIYIAVAALEQQPLSPERRDNLLKRLHALGSSAKILGFAAAAESLTRAEQQLRTGLADTLADDVNIVRSLLGNLPSLVLRGSYSIPPNSLPAVSSVPASPAPLAQGPWCVLVCGNPILAESLESLGTASSGFELIQTEDPHRLRELCAMYGPDVVLLDGALDNLTEELKLIREMPETASAQLIVAQASEERVAELKQAGAHTVLSSALSALSLWRAANRSRTDEHSAPLAREPIGEVGLRDLCDRLTRELKRGLYDSADDSSQSATLSFGEGTEIRAALWAAIAKIRELVVARSNGRVHFGPGPDGSVVLATGANLGLRGRTSPDSASLDLTGRRIIVADDDPAVAWFIGGTLRAAGAEVREAQDGRRALALVYHWWPDLVVSDVLMPGLDGFALCREIKRDVALRDVPVILLSWKEDLLFRIRELGADADGYVRKEASASALVDRIRELLWPRVSLERRLRVGQEVRGRLDGITPRTLLHAACRLGRHLRITLRDASAHYDVRIREHTVRAVTRTRTNGAVTRGQTALATFLGVSAGRFSIVEDDQPAEDQFALADLDEVLRIPILRARAAQRVLSGAALGTVDHVALDPDAFADELTMLPLSLRPLVDELLRGTAPGQLLSVGAASLQSLESLLTDAARRGAVQTICNKDGDDLLTREILALSAPLSEHPPVPPPAVSPQFSFQLTPSPQPAASAAPAPPPTVKEPSIEKPQVSAAQLPDLADATAAKPSTVAGDFDWAAEASWESSDSPGSEPAIAVPAERQNPYSRPRLSAEWGSDKHTTDSATTALTTSPFAIVESSAHAAPSESVPQPAATPAASGESTATSAAPVQPHETPELAAVVAAQASDSQSPLPLRTTYLGLPIGPGAMQVHFRSVPAPVVREKSPAAKDTPQPQKSSASESPTTSELPPTASSNNFSGPQTLQAAADVPPAAAPTASATPLAAEDEVVFPLYSSNAPPGSSPPAGLVPTPVIEVGPPELHDTLHSALAPEAPAEVRPFDSSALNVPEPAKDEPAQATERAASVAATEATDPNHTTAGDHPEPASTAPIDSPDATQQPASSAAEVPPVESVESRSAAPQSASSRDTATRNGKTWLVPLSLAVTAGVLSFTVALPILQRLQPQRPPASAELPITTAEVPAPSAPLEPRAATSAAGAIQQPSATAASSQPPPGVVLVPDKGVVELKTSGVHSIFVDDEFVGRGPSRIVTLTPGSHRVRVSLNGEEHTETIDAPAGQFTTRQLDTNE